MANSDAIMAKDAPLFLSRTQAIEAVCDDFRQYPPQLLLFSEILPILSDGNFHLKREPARNGAWINTGTHGKMRWMEGPDLAAHMCDVITNTPLGLEELAAICARVFQSGATPCVAKGSNQQGLFIETGMSHFQCRQCGRCCRTLDYHDELTAEDVQQWRNLGRHDILEWVAGFKTGGQTTYRIWVHPGTGELASPCPFLKGCNSANRWSCRIHPVKPAICRDYPMSRKHGLMTGCPGFTEPEA